MSAKKVNEAIVEVLMLTAAIFVLALSTVNMNSYLSPKEVLGASTILEDDATLFWQDFLSRNPEYVPGWIELGNIDKAMEIDPNYIIP